MGTESTRYTDFYEFCDYFSPLVHQRSLRKMDYPLAPVCSDKKEGVPLTLVNSLIPPVWDRDGDGFYADIDGDHSVHK